MRFSVKMASISPIAHEMRRPGHSPTEHYKIPACEDVTKPVIFEISDQETTSRVPVVNVYRKEKWSAIDVAQDFLKEIFSDPWCDANGHPGVFIFFGEKPTDTEIAEAFKAQVAYANRVVEYTNAKWAAAPDPRWVQPLMRACARFLQRDVPWMSTEFDLQQKKCVFCKKSIEIDAVVCSFCNQVVDQRRYAELTAPLAAKTPVAKESSAA